MMAAKGTLGGAFMCEMLTPKG